MSLRDTIRRLLHDEEYRSSGFEGKADLIMAIPEIAAIDQMSAGTLLMPEPMTIQLGAPSGIEQGVTRLRLAAFLSGHRGPWNVVGDNPWVRYRGHQIDRETTADGYVARTAYLDHLSETRSAAWAVGKDGRYALGIIKMIDELLDIVIEHHGVPGEELVAAEIVETIDSATAARVIDSYATYTLTAVASGQQMGKVRDYYIRAIERGEVTP